MTGPDTPSGQPGNPPEVTDSPPDLQRGDANVPSTRSAAHRVQRAIALVLLGTLGAGLLTWYYSAAFTRAAQAKQSARSATARTADTESVLPPLPTPPKPPEPTYRIGSVLGDPTATLPADLTLAEENPSRRPATRQRQTPAEMQEDRELTGAVFVRPARLASPTPENPSALEAAAPSGPAPAAAPTALNALGVTPPVELVKASLLPTQRLLLPKGSFLDCTLETAMDSQLPGLTTCLTAVDTFSADGSVVLLERGTRLIGETRGSVAQGASRIFVLWTQARTPTGVIVPLASPGTDELGRSGLPGEVDRHFWDRFGAAILISLIDGTVQAAAANQARGQGAVILNPNGTRDIATEVLRSTVNIAPTVRKPQGDRIQILVARDLDFRSVYELQSR